MCLEWRTQGVEGAEDFWFVCHKKDSGVIQQLRED